MRKSVTSGNVCTSAIIAKSTQPFSSTITTCLLMNALLVSRPCETLGVQLRASLPALEKGEVLLLSQAQPTMVGIEIDRSTSSSNSTSPTIIAKLPIPLISPLRHTLSHPRKSLTYPPNLSPINRIEHHIEKSSPLCL